MSKKETLHLYLRCSTDNQIENSIERQRDLGIKFSKDIGMDYKVWSDEGKSGIKSFEDTREQLVGLLWEVELGMVKHIWVEDFTRLTRNFEDQVKIEKLIIENELFVYEGLTNNQIYQPNDLSQRLIKVVTSMVGTDQKKKEIQKSIDQKLKKFKQGYYVRGNVTYGFNKVDGYLVENKDESKWVKKMFKWYLDGDSLNDIMKKCKVHGLKSKRGNDWSSEGVRISLSNIEYTGKTQYTDKTKDPHRKNPKKYPYPDESTWEVHINDNLPRIVSDEIFNKVQKKLDVYKTKKTKNIYFLHGKIKCSCGCDWVGRTKSRIDRNKPPESYYQCNNTDRYYHRKRPNRQHLYKTDCNKPKRLKSSDIDDYIWNQLLHTLRNSSFIKERVKTDLLGGKLDTTSSRRKVNKDKKELHKELKSLEQSRVQLIKEKFTLQLSDVDFNDINTSITIKVSELKSELDKVNQRELLLDKRSEWIDWISEHHNQVNEYQGITDIKKRRKILDIYIDRVKVNYVHETQQHNLDIHYRYPLMNDGIEYVTDKNSRIKWDKWGKNYRIKKGDQVVSLSDIKGSDFGVDFNYSTVTDFVSELVPEIPFLIFEYKITTHKLYNSGYSKPLSKKRKKLHNEIMSLHNKGWGYTKIHRYLVKNGFEIGKSRTTVDSIIKKIKKREEFLSKSIIDGIGNFRVEMMEV